MKRAIRCRPKVGVHLLCTGRMSMRATTLLRKKIMKEKRERRKICG
uniref:Uncharacterized protein n=1 Tax=Manihot esculenta TaxID=3983 RepID=A0A2C9UZB3_MANES